MCGLVRWDHVDAAAAEVAWGASHGRRVYNRAVSRIYSLQDADDIVPGIAVIVQRLRDFRIEVIALSDAERLRAASLAAEGDGALADDPELLRLRLRTRGLVDQMQADAAWLDERDIILRDISTGLLDFPGESNGQPIWLCWRLGEPAVTAWHPRDEGFAGRRPVAELR